MEPLGEKLINWLDEQYAKLRRCKICGASYRAHEIEGEDGKRGHRINKELAELNGVPYLAGVFHWFTLDEQSQKYEQSK